jgi:2,4-dienoyl-CoA reductase-like NADH-dependent reductase (Old Yellow Enzyme family)
VPLSEHVRRHAEIMTMAVGPSSMATKPRRSCATGRPDLIAVGREILNNPN